MEFIATIRKITDNSLGITIPHEIVKKFGLKPNDQEIFEIKVSQSKPK